MEHLGFPTETVIIFVVTICLSLFLDLFAHKQDKVMTLRSACLWSIFWVAISVAFGIYLYFHHGSDMASLFFTGYVLEKALSVDNLFVIMAIFSWFSIPNEYRHRVLYWGVLGAIVFRAIFVAIGAELLALGPYVEVLFAAMVGYTAVVMLRKSEEEKKIEDYSSHIAYRGVKRFFPMWPRMHGHDFFLSRKHAEEESQRLGIAIDWKGHKAAFVATPLFLCLAVIEVSDVMFAFDSVPAIIAVSREPLIIYSAMIFAILGLRSLYFVLEVLSRYLIYLEKAVIILLFFISVKLLLSAIKHLFDVGVDLSPTFSLIVVLSILSIGVIASFFKVSKKPQTATADAAAQSKVEEASTHAMTDAPSEQSGKDESAK